MIVLEKWFSDSHLAKVCCDPSNAHFRSPCYMSCIFKDFRNKAGPSQIFNMLGSRLQVSERCLDVAQFCLCERLGLGHFEPCAQTDGENNPWRSEW